MELVFSALLPILELVIVDRGSGSAASTSTARVLDAKVTAGCMDATKEEIGLAAARFINGVAVG